MPNLTVRDTWIVRGLRWLKALTIADSATFAAGGGHGRDWATAPDMPPLEALAAPTRFPYLYAAASIVSSDMAAVPLRVQRGTGPDAERIEDHPFLGLLEQPNQGESGSQFLRQVWYDYLLNGWAVVLLLRDGSGNVDALIRLHPAQCRVITDTFGFLRAVEYSTLDAGSRIYQRSDLLYFRRPAWQVGPADEYGTGWVQPLRDDLNAELRVVKFNEKSFASGRPDIVATLKDPAAPPAIGQTRQDLERQINDNMRRSHGGVHLLSGAYDLSAFGTSPKDMQGIEQRDWNRRAVIAVTHVPPIKLGLETANYATAVQQEKEYWTYYVGEANNFADEWTRLAREMGDARDRVIVDTSVIPALQEDRTARLTRVGQHLANGMTASDAYAYEGFQDAPITDIAEESAPAEEPSPATASGVALQRWWAAKTAEPVDREKLWKAFADDLHTPLERRFTLAIARVLRAQRARYAARLAEALGAKAAPMGDTKALTESLIANLLSSSAELQLFIDALSPLVSAATRASFASTARQVRRDLRQRKDKDESARLAREAAAQILKLNEQAVLDIVDAGLDSGLSVAELQTEIAGSTVFSVERARAIARTEVTRSLNQGAAQAYDQAQADGVEFVGKQWLSSRDSRVREAHADLDGQTVPLDADFVVPPGSDFAGEKGPYPGAFSEPGMVVNCRCTTVPVVR